MSGQTLTDRIAAAQYQLTGSDMARAVCKATTHEVMAPKKKHLECKCTASSSPPLHVPALLGPSRTASNESTCHYGYMVMAQSFLNWLSLNGCGAIRN